MLILIDFIMNLNVLKAQIHNSQTTQNEIHGLEVQRMWSLQDKRNNSYMCYGTA